MTLQPSFALTPRSSYFSSADPYYFASLWIYGILLYPKFYLNDFRSFDIQHAQDNVYFDDKAAADPSLDYTQFQNLKRAPHVILNYNLSSYGNQKELALVFGFNANNTSRLLIFSSAGQLGDVTMAQGDNQFLIEIENLTTIAHLYFIHVNNPGFINGGRWFFRGITGYVI